MLTDSIKQKVKEIMKTYPSLTGASFGKKITNNKYTGEIGFIFYTKKKLPLNELNPSEIFPSTIIVDGVSYVTDVISMHRAEFVCDPSILGQCYGFRPNINSCNISSNNQQNLVRPIQGGVQVNEANQGSGVGTMGFIAVDNTTNCLVGVTNNHVVIPNYITTSQRSTTNGFTNEAGVTVGQPYSSSSVGRIVRSIPTFMYPGENHVDGALFALCANTVDTSVSWKQYGIPVINSPMPFATTAEIDNLLSSNPPVAASGRSTGPKYGTCGLVISSLSAVVQFGIPNSWLGNVIFQSNDNLNKDTIVYYDCIEFTRPDPTCANPVAKGDSGSALCAEIGGVWKIIGLVFGASFHENYPDECTTLTMPCCDYFSNQPSFTKGFACRIDRVAEELSISAWDGTAKPFATTLQTITFPGGISNPTVVCNGKEYWQIGNTTSNNPCP